MNKCICENCKKEFWVRPCRKNIAKYCSYKCYWKKMIPWCKGTKGIVKPHYGCFKKGHKSGMTGKYHSEETKKKIAEGRQGKNHPSWKGGKIKTQAGYIHIWTPNHPFCDKSKYVNKSHLVIEKIIGRYIQSNEVVHHVNFNVSDNRPKNLQLLTKGQHSALHNKLRKKTCR